MPILTALASVIMVAKVFASPEIISESPPVFLEALLWPESEANNTSLPIDASFWAFKFVFDEFEALAVFVESAPFLLFSADAPPGHVVHWLAKIVVPLVVVVTVPATVASPDVTTLSPPVFLIALLWPVSLFATTLLTTSAVFTALTEVLSLVVALEVF